jgi:hypothetical protein
MAQLLNRHLSERTHAGVHGGFRHRSGKDAEHERAKLGRDACAYEWWPDETEDEAMNEALRAALLAKHGSPQAALKALGLDASLLQARDQAGTGSAERERLRLDSDRLNRQRSAFKEHETFGVDRGGGAMQSRSARRIHRAVYDDGSELGPEEIGRINRILCGEETYDGMPGENELPVSERDTEERQGGEDRRRRLGRDGPEPFYGRPTTRGELDWHSGRDWREAEDRRMAQDARPRSVVSFHEAFPAAAKIRLGSLNGL